MTLSKEFIFLPCQVTEGKKLPLIILEVENQCFKVLFFNEYTGVSSLNFVNLRS